MPLFLSLAARPNPVKDTYLISKIVLEGLAAAWFFAASPTRRSSSVKATYEGVIRLPIQMGELSACDGAKAWRRVLF